MPSKRTHRSVSLWTAVSCVYSLQGNSIHSSLLRVLCRNAKQRFEYRVQVRAPASDAESCVPHVRTFLRLGLAPCHSSSPAAVAPDCYLRRNLEHPRPRQSQIQEWQQKHVRLLECAGRSLASLARGCCLRHVLDDPRSQQPQIQEWWMCWTFLSCSRIWLLSPPHLAWPQVTTPPHSRMAAKEPADAWMLWTFFSCFSTWLLSPPHCG